MNNHEPCRYFDACFTSTQLRPLTGHEAARYRLFAGASLLHVAASFKNIAGEGVMASQPRKPSSAPNSIQKTLAKSLISLDLLGEFEKSRGKKRTKAIAATEAGPPDAVKRRTFNVIVEFNRSFPGGIEAARLTLLNAYSKARKELDAASKARLASLAASCPQSTIDDASLVKAFGAEDMLDISKSLWTDNYVFGALSKETIGSLPHGLFLSPKSPSRQPANLTRQPKSPFRLFTKSGSTRKLSVVSTSRAAP